MKVVSAAVGSVVMDPVFEQAFEDLINSKLDDALDVYRILIIVDVAFGRLVL